MNDAKEQHDKSQIFVNGEHTTWEKKTISYAEVVNLAFPSHGADEMFAVMYTHGPNNSKGTLVDGQETNITNGMRFDVHRSNKS